MTTEDSASPTLSAVSRTALGWLRPYTRHCLGALALMLMAVAFTTFLSLASRALIDNALGPRDPGRFIQLVAIVAAGYLLYAAACVGRDKIIAVVAGRVARDLRWRMYDRLQRVELGYFSRHEAGDVVARFSNDLAPVQQAFRQTLPWMAYAALQVIAGVVIMFALNWELAIPALLFVPLASIGPRLLGPRAAAASEDVRKAEGLLLGTIGERVAGQPVIRAFGWQPAFAGSFRASLAALTAAAIRANFSALLVGRSAGLAVILGQALVAVVGAALVFTGTLTAGTLVGFLGLLTMASASISDLSAALPEWLQASGSMRRIQDLLAEPVEDSEPAAPVELGRLSSAIELRGVSFDYGGIGRGVHDVSLSIPAGTFAGLVGPSGSGKSTLLSLISRLHRPDAGTVSFDGHDLAAVNEPSLRGQLSVVFAEPFLFSGTVIENIRLGKPDASDAEVEAAARAAQAHEFIGQMPHGYDSAIPAAGGLSTGQRQRLALARAIVRDPAVLLLDEATSALDPATEAGFTAALRDVRRGRTVISVSHRLATVRDADVIFVLRDGRLVETGTHDQLLRLQGEYCRLWRKQSGFELSGDGQRAEVDARRLADIPLFADVDPALLTEVAGWFFTARFQPGATVFATGDPGDTFFILVRGQAEASFSTEAGEQPLETLEDGDVFGEVELIRGAQRTTTVRARTECITLALAGDHFRDLLARVPLLEAIVRQFADVRAQRQLERVSSLRGTHGWSDER